MTPYTRELLLKRVNKKIEERAIFAKKTELEDNV